MFTALCQRMRFARFSLIIVSLLAGLMAAWQTPADAGGFHVIYTVPFSYGGWQGLPGLTGPLIVHNGALFGVNSTAWGSYGNPPNAIFELTPPTAGGAWTETALYTNLSSLSAVTADGAGNLYATSQGVLRLTPPALPGDSWSATLSPLFFDNGGDGGALTLKGLWLFGASQGSTFWDEGNLFAVLASDPSVQHRLHHFTGSPDGHSPLGSLLLKNNLLYGVTEHGGASACPQNSLGCGTVFQLTPPSTPGSPWSEAVIYNFPNGSEPQGNLVADQNGVLYGVTQDSFTQDHQDCGTAFALTPPPIPGGTWTETTLVNLGSGLPYGPPCALNGGLIYHDGIFYGTSLYGGVNYGGTVYALIPPAASGGGWTVTVLYSFPFSDEYGPNGPLAIFKGLLVGTTPTEVFTIPPLS